MPSRIGKQSILVPEGVIILLNGKDITVSGPKGSLNLEIPSGIKIILNNNLILVEIDSIDSPKSRSKQGLIRSLLANAVKGVNLGWEKKLEIIGVGFKASLNEKDLNLSLGFSHGVQVKPLPEVSLAVKGNIITVTGVDKQKVGQMASSIRDLKKPEPYKGKGIRYFGEQVRKKAGKAAKAVGK